jgi:hypothetical protein
MPRLDHGPRDPDEAVRPRDPDEAVLAEMRAVLDKMAAMGSVGQDGGDPNGRRESTLSAAHAAVQTVEADNGEVYRVMQTIHSRDGTAQAQIATPDNDVMNFVFDCRGHMATQTSGMRSIPPRSVAGRIAAIACGSVAGH